MTECGTSGSNQPTPVVHSGIMYLLNCEHIMQALDAATATPANSSRTTVKTMK